MSTATARQRELDRLARADHERGCRNEPAFEAMTISHAMVHEAEAIRQWNRAHGADLSTIKAREATSSQRDAAADHVAHRGNHNGYACGFSGPHCWECGEPWPCRWTRGVWKPKGGG